jgi:caffeoyl-CoA O-methyltransferase
MMRKNRGLWLLIFSMFFPFLISPGFSQSTEKDEGLDERVQAFLSKTGNSWYDMNVPQVDGEILYRLVIENGYKKALEIGTSTGRSGIYIAWALSKTGGRLTTIEIDEGRYNEALANFKEAGLSEHIDARLADAHELVPELPGPFDFVFIDADKGWYTQYARAVVPKLEPGGCIAAHNVYERSGRRGGYGGTQDYYEYMKSLAGFRSQILSESLAGISVSYKNKMNR